MTAETRKNFFSPPKYPHHKKNFSTPKKFDKFTIKFFFLNKFSLEDLYQPQIEGDHLLEEDRLLETREDHDLQFIENQRALNEKNPRVLKDPNLDLQYEIQNKHVTKLQKKKKRNIPRTHEISLNFLLYIVELFQVDVILNINEIF